MFPEYVVDVLQQLSYIALIVIAPCTVYNTIMMIVLKQQAAFHVFLDDERFERVSKHLGRHDSEINDLRADEKKAHAEMIAVMLKEIRRNE